MKYVRALQYLLILRSARHVHHHLGYDVAPFLESAGSKLANWWGRANCQGSEVQKIPVRPNGPR